MIGRNRCVTTSATTDETQPPSPARRVVIELTSFLRLTRKQNKTRWHTRRCSFGPPTFGTSPTVHAPDRNRPPRYASRCSCAALVPRVALPGRANFCAELSGRRRRRRRLSQQTRGSRGGAYGHSGRAVQRHRHRQGPAAPLRVLARHPLDRLMAASCCASVAHVDAPVCCVCVCRSCRRSLAFCHALLSDSCTIAVARCRVIRVGRSLARGRRDSRGVSECV